MISIPKKLRGAGHGQQSELTRLKALPPQQRAEVYSWRDEQPTLTNEQVRARIQERFGITLRRDGQLSDFWAWQFQQVEEERKSRLDLALDDLEQRLHREFQLWRERLTQELTPK